MEPLHLPTEVIDWVRGMFRGCNERIATKLSNNPNLPEESLDLTWIEHFSQFSSPVNIAKTWTVKVETHYLGGLRHHLRWEVADVGVLLFIRRAGVVEKSKVA